MNYQVHGRVAGWFDDFATGFLECANNAQDQLREEIGDPGSFSYRCGLCF